MKINKILVVGIIKIFANTLKSSLNLFLYVKDVPKMIFIPIFNISVEVIKVLKIIGSLSSLRNNIREIGVKHPHRFKSKRCGFCHLSSNGEQDGPVIRYRAKKVENNRIGKVF